MENKVKPIYNNKGSFCKDCGVLTMLVFKSDVERCCDCQLKHDPPILVFKICNDILYNLNEKCFEHNMTIRKLESCGWFAYEVHTTTVDNKLYFHYYMKWVGNKACVRLDHFINTAHTNAPRCVDRFMCFNEEATWSIS